MYIKVDDVEQEPIEGFSYSNAHGSVEVVKMGFSYVIFQDNCDEDISEIYYEDIPKAIKALQMAYNYKNKGGV